MNSFLCCVGGELAAVIDMLTFDSVQGTAGMLVQGDGCQQAQAAAQAASQAPPAVHQKPATLRARQVRQRYLP